MDINNRRKTLAVVFTRGSLPWILERRSGWTTGGRGSMLKFDGEFDFETANAQFDKEEIEKELKDKLNVGQLIIQTFAPNQFKY